MILLLLLHCVVPFLLLLLLFAFTAGLIFVISFTNAATVERLDNRVLLWCVCVSYLCICSYTYFGTDTFIAFSHWFPLTCYCFSFFFFTSTNYINYSIWILRLIYHWWLVYLSKCERVVKFTNVPVSSWFCQLYLNVL